MCPAMRLAGAEIALTYLNDRARPYVEPLAREVERGCCCRWRRATTARWMRCSRP